MLGRSYLIEYCVRYYKEKADERKFRVNLTETNRGLFCFLTGNWNEDEVPRYAKDNVSDTEKKELTEQEIIDNIRNKLSELGE